MNKKKSIFDFKDIFPKCIKDFNTIEKEKGNNVHNDKFYIVCYLIENELNIKMQGFINFCVYFSNYLERIIPKNVDNREPYCKYFNYLLKDVLYYLSSSSCSGEKKCYQEMIKVYKKKDMNNMNICDTFVKDLEDNVYKVLNYLNSLYNYLEVLKIDSSACESNTSCFRHYNDFLKKCDEMKNDSLNNVMGIIKEQFKYYVRIEREIIPVPKQLQSTPLITARKVIIIMCIITLAITFIPFILYKVNNKLNLHINTTCRTYLEPSLRELKKYWHKKIKQNLKLFNQFENSFEELMDKNSEKTYNTLYYP
ncbi:variable surface protein [Plasmodium gonderi]|uniref:Variable surface protein n=1 Tax=Plasmodium gonderi TaxID=77519 RepID=A0A1Y1JWI8_PLAGO|nr:variable surface protein [Plasmodium gonderi]GAW84214.1 variable surface protein [Plasmodium gonderi]